MKKKIIIGIVILMILSFIAGIVIAASVQDKREELYHQFGPKLLDAVVQVTLSEINILRVEAGLLRLDPVDIAPETCTSTILGAIYFDVSEDDMCVCKSGGWFVMADGSACT